MAMNVLYEKEEMPAVWDQMLAGDSNAMLAIYEQHYADLLSYGVQLCGSIDTAKDAINDVFLHLWEHRSNLKPVSQVKAYLFTCIRRRVFEPVYFNNKLLSADEYRFDQLSEISYEEVLIAMQRSDEVRKKVQLALNKLTDRQKELIRLKYYENLDYQQIEQVTGMNVKTAYNTVYNAMKVLSAELKGKELALLVLFWEGFSSP